MRVNTQSGRKGDRDIDALVGTMVGVGVWTAAQGDAKRREFYEERREDDAYIRTGRRRPR